ncbi:MAG TPA: hypothetical protein VFD26_07495, partial [Methyloceanibacter sp.]|nr:hypothetical protein [Methyloceanibacter sp.]
RGRLLMVSPDKMGTACPLSGRNSTYRPVQISGTGSLIAPGISRKIEPERQQGDCRGLLRGQLLRLKI